MRIAASAPMATRSTRTSDSERSSRRSGVARQELPHVRHDVEPGEGVGQRQTQQALRMVLKRRYGVARFVDLAQHGEGVAVEGRAGLGQVQRARGAVEEVDIELLLECGDRARHRRGLNVEECRGAREAGLLDDAHEAPHGDQHVHDRKLKLPLRFTQKSFAAAVVVALCRTA